MCVTFIWAYKSKPFVLLLPVRFFYSSFKAGQSLFFNAQKEWGKKKKGVTSWLGLGDTRKELDSLQQKKKKSFKLIFSVKMTIMKI